eukprot:3581337-Pyramimonas_sp.AAC.2
MDPVRPRSNAVPNPFALLSVEKLVPDALPAALLVSLATVRLLELGSVALLNVAAPRPVALPNVDVLVTDVML